MNNKRIGTFSKVSPNSSTKIDVVCKYGHKYKRAAYLVTRGCECPECKKRRLSIANKPKIMKYWDYEKNKNLDPYKLFEYMRIKAHWKCPKCGYEWESAIANRSLGLCPCCDVGTAIKPGYNDVLTIVPSLKNDFEQSKNKGIDLSKIGVADKKTKVHWTCSKCGYEWESTIFSRTRGHQGQGNINKCPVCGKAKRIITFSSLHPELEQFYSPKNVEPFEKFHGDYQKDYLWECEIHGTYSQKLSSMIRAVDSKYHGCPLCASKTLNEANSLKRNYPELFKELSFVDNCILMGDDISATSNKKVWWICPICGKKYAMSTRDRVMFHKRKINSCNNCKKITTNITHYF